MARLRGHSGLKDRGLERGTSAPSGAAVGQMWFNTNTGVLYQYTNQVLLDYNLYKCLNTKALIDTIYLNHNF